jgi:hypothetical protein
MRSTHRFVVILVLLSFVALPACGQGQGQAGNSATFNRIKALPGVTSITAGRGGRGGGEVFELAFEQPVDHQKPDGARFTQRVYVSHVDDAKPVLLGTEGYSANGIAGGELQQMLGGNQITVEHRYFGRSIPSPLDWQYLTVKQAADDMHAIVAAFKQIYSGKWVSTGTSKGGQTALFFKCYYPDDVDATVAYVAPVNVTQEDPRINEFMRTVGDAATRRKIADFQISLLKREAEMLPLIKAQADRQRWTFAMGLAKAYEYGVLEYPYAFWQNGTNPADIPAPDAAAEVLAAHYNRVGTLRYYSDQGKKQFEAFQYQAFTEIGYYNYDITDFKPYLKANPNPTNLDLCPDGAKIVYNPATMAFVYNFLQYKADRVAYIYGEIDAWSATQMNLIGRTDAIKIVVRDSHHNARVSAFTPEQKEAFYAALDRWLETKVTRR